HHLPHKPEIPRVEDLELRLHPQVSQNARALAQIVGRGHVRAVAVAEVETTAVEGRDVRAIESLVRQIDDMPNPVFLAAEVRAGRRRILQAVVANTNVATHAAGEVDDHIDPALADALHNLPIVPRFHTEGASLRI